MHGRRGGAEAGFTLFELLVVLGILVGLAMIAASAVRSLRRSDLREESGRLARLLRYAFDRSMETGKCTRVAIDLDKQTYSLQESEQRFFLPRSNDEQSRRRLEQRKEQLRAGSGINQALVSQAQSAGVDPSLFLPPEPDSQLASFHDVGGKPVRLSAAVRVADVLTTRDVEKSTQGKAYVYCFPEGFVERAVVHLVDRDDRYYTLVTQPLRGGVKIQSDDVEYTPADLAADGVAANPAESTGEVMP